MDQKSDIDKQIGEAEKRNNQMTQILEELKEKIKTMQGKKESEVIDEESKVKNQSEEAALKNVLKKIENYKKEIQKLDGVSTERFTLKIKQTEERIKAVQNKTEFYNKEIRKIEDSFRVKKTQNSFDFESFYTNVYTLEKKLNRLKKTRNPTQKMSSLKKSSYTSIRGSETGQKRQGIDREAMYRNLIKFYTNQEIKLKQSIKQLEKQHKKEEEEGELLDKEISEYERKISEKRATLKK